MQALGSLTGLTRCLFTLGFGALPALVVHLRNVSGPEIPFGLLALLNAIMAGALQWATGDGTKWLHAKVGGTERVSINASSRAVGLAATVDEGLGALRETATVS
mgnify:FL=1|tara:strand:+ start:289 stop:600 length:312 start_codon:yes stop_codon:yes gene_type:complete